MSLPAPIVKVVPVTTPFTFLLITSPETVTVSSPASVAKVEPTKLPPIVTESFSEPVLTSAFISPSTFTVSAPAPVVRESFTA